MGAYTDNFTTGFDAGLADRAAGKHRHPHFDAEFALLCEQPGFHDGYQSGWGPDAIDMDAVAVILRKRGFDRSYVEQTGGGCATIYCGPPTWEEEGWGERWGCLAGPGTFEGPSWTVARGSVQDFYAGPDDDGDSVPTTVWSTDPEDVADIIAEHAQRKSPHFREDPGITVELAARFTIAQRRFRTAEREMSDVLEAMAFATLRSVFPTVTKITGTGSMGDQDMIFMVDQLLDADGTVVWDAETDEGEEHADFVSEVESNYLNWLAALSPDDFQGEQEIDGPPLTPAPV